MSSLFSSRHLGRLSTFGVLALLLIAGCGDGEDGQTPIVQSDAADEETCPYGGTVITTGYADDSGQIADGDIIDQSIVCNGAPGATGDEGDAGEDGQEGRDAIVQTSTEDPGDNCEQGGVAIETGFDESGDGEIDEVADVTYLCNLDQCSTGQPLDFELHTDDLPDELVQGFTYELDVTVAGETPENLAVSALNAGINDVQVEASYDEDEQVLAITHIEGEGTTSLAIVASDGCDTATETFTFGPFDEGLAELHVAHLFPGAGTVEIVPVGEDDPIADVDELDVISSFNAVEIPWGVYDLEVFDEDGTSLGTFDEISVEPFSTNMAYAYSDDGDLALGIMSSDVEDPESGDFRARAIHTADSGPDVDVYAINPATQEETLLFEDLAFGDFSNQIDLPVASDSYIGLDTTDDGEVDVSYSTTMELFEDGTNFELFAYFDEEDDDLWLLSFDYDATTTNSVNLHDPNEVAPANIVVGHLFPGAGEVAIWDTDADMDDDDPIAELDDFDFTGYNEIDAGTYDFEFFDDSGDSLGTTGDIEIDPFSFHLVYAYDDGDGLGLNALEIDFPILDDEFALRGHHLADDVDPVDLYAVMDDDNSLLFEDVAFEDVTDTTAFDADTDAFAGIDSDDDGTPDLEYSSTSGAFADGARLEAFAVYDDDVVKLVTYDHNSESSAVHDYRISSFVSVPDLHIPDGDDFSDTLEVSDCDTVDSITMDIDLDFIFSTVWLTLRLEAPDGTEITLWAEGSAVDGSDRVAGNFNDTIAPDGDDSVPISDLEGVDGNGDWTLYGDNRSTARGGNLNSWGLNLVCD